MAKDIVIDDEMVERAAKELCDYPRLWEGAPEDGWKEHWRAKARRVLAAALRSHAQKEEG